jgi:hypothetical protein
VSGRYALRRECEAIAARLHVTLERDNAGSVYTLTADVPIASVFAANHGHSLVSTGRFASWKSAEPVLYADMLERLRHGLTTCDDDECDYCHALGD